MEKTAMKLDCSYCNHPVCPHCHFGGQKFSLEKFPKLNKKFDLIGCADCTLLPYSFKIPNNKKDCLMPQEEPRLV